MWKVLLFLACVASLTVVYCDDPPTSKEAQPTDETNPILETNPTVEAEPAGEIKPVVEAPPTDGTDEVRSYGCNGHRCDKNEEWNNCTNTGCIPTRCSELGFPLKCDKKCKPGCVCKQGYVRDDNGVCILINDCPSCGGDKNAQQGCGNNCGHTCESYNKPPRPCPLFCIFNGCNCRPGFVYDNNIKACVKPKDCTPVCQVNEQFSNCTNGGCVAKNCSQIDKLVPCVKIDPKYCIKGCICVEGYLRAANGTCVPKDQCTQHICGKNEEWNNCTDTGCIPTRCSEIGFPLKCDKKCKPGCVCKQGYVRDDNGVCILINDCPSCGGDKNAQQGCSNYCGHTCESYNKPPGGCPYFCIINGCDCRPGFVYDNNIKACVKPKDCTPVCQVNEQFSNCTNGGCVAKNCSQIGKPVPCVKIDPKYCIKGCICVEGYLRDENGTCVPKDQCTQHICDKNEEWNNCTNTGCIPTRCSDLGFPLKCDKKCKPGCVCKQGYVRDESGVCILINDCPSCGGDKNAQQGCGNNCGHTCESYNKPPPPCPLFCIFNGCNCRPGFVYDNNIKACVKPKDCTPVCQVNEQFSNCTNGGCVAKNCSQIGKPVPCVKIDPKYCIKGCICVDGYLKAANGTCVPKDQCPPKCDKPNDVYDVCPAPCPPRRCDVNNAVIRCKAPPKPGDPECQPGCRCADNYYRNATGTCVPKNQCEKPLKCDRPNEVYNPCPAICPPQDCRVDLTVILCMRNPEYGDPNCRPSCVCIEGYVRNDTGDCIPRDQCPPPCKVNERHSDCINGGCEARNCSQVGKPVPCVKIDPKHCIKGCICVEGYLRLANGTCVPKDQCPPICTGPNEYWEECIQGCSNQTCGSIGQVYFCPYQKGCKSGCRCNPGFYRNDVNVCIPESECPKCDKPNEVYDVCPAPCPPRRCDVNDAVIRCKAPPKPGDPECQPGCRCADNYYRNATGTCVPKNQCEKPLKCDRPNEVYNPCPAICPPQDCRVDLTVILCMRNPEYGDPNCRPSCVCIEGYVRNDTGDCIPRDQCPPPCKVNERHSDCINGGCEARNCSQVGKPVPCVKIDPKHCIKGCICVEGYLKLANGTCVPKDQCPPMCTGPNEYWEECIQGCSNQTCGSIGQVYFCPYQKGCKSGCRCNPGFYRNDVNVCIPESECPKTCGKNEHWETCIQSCSNDTCDEIGKSYSCPANLKCKSGCRCDKGYWRDSNNMCIPQSQCPKPCGKNEYWQKCILDCSNQTCEDLNTPPRSCPAQIVGDCKSGCRCNPEHSRNSDNVCIPNSECPKPCRKNEYWANCDYGCSNQTCNDIGVVRSCPLQIVGQCKGRCLCKEGYWRNDYNECIPESECPRCYGKNENWVKCITDCSNQTCADIGKIFHCPNIPAGTCKAGCRCRQGTWRNATGVCVPQNECPTPECPAGEVWSWCPTVKCDGDNCPKTKDSPQTCPIGIVCDKPRCVCGVNRKRDRITGKCIPITDCPKFKCDCNEEYQACPVSCPGENCSDYTNQRKCPPGRIGILLICRPTCKCIKGYYRKADGTCVPACACPEEPTTVATTPSTEGPSTGGGTGLTGILDGIIAFTGKSLHNRMKSGPSENIILSAMSVFTPIGELCLYSTGPAYDQCIKVLNLLNKDDIRKTFPILTASYEGQTSVTFTTASKIYSDDKYKLSDELNKDVVDVFDADSQELDFSKNTLAAQIINAWVASKTNNLITDLVTPDMFSALTRIVLVNAIYFKGNWLYRFEKNNTKQEDFYLSDGTTKKTKLMSLLATFNYGEFPEYDCAALEMYYEGKNCSMVVLLPNQINGSISLAEKLQDSVIWNNIRENLVSQKVQVYLPPFEINTSTDLQDLLEKVNITKWFNPDDSGLTGLLEKEEPVYVSAAIQKASIICNEDGSEAAAANAVVVGTRSLPRPPAEIVEFKANRGFLYYLTKGSLVLFAGAYNS